MSFNRLKEIQKKNLCVPTNIAISSSDKSKTTKQCNSHDGLCIFVRTSDGHYLLMRHVNKRENDLDKIKNLESAGGFAVGGESYPEGARRELGEESGLILPLSKFQDITDDVHKSIPSTRNQKRRKRYFLYNLPCDAETLRSQLVSKDNGIEVKHVNEDDKAISVNIFYLLKIDQLKGKFFKSKRWDNYPIIQNIENGKIALSNNTVHSQEDEKDIGLDYLSKYDIDGQENNTITYEIEFRKQLINAEKEIRAIVVKNLHYKQPATRLRKGSAASISIRDYEKIETMKIEEEFKNIESNSEIRFDSISVDKKAMYDFVRNISRLIEAANQIKDKLENRKIKNRTISLNDLYREFDKINKKIIKNIKEIKKSTKNTQRSRKWMGFVLSL